MANYYDYAICDITNPDNVGAGGGDTEEGDDRICITLSGRRLPNADVDEYVQMGWHALTPACARQLYDLLGVYFAHDVADAEKFLHAEAAAPIDLDAVSKMLDSLQENWLATDGALPYIRLMRRLLVELQKHRKRAAFDQRVETSFRQNKIDDVLCCDTCTCTPNKDRT